MERLAAALLQCGRIRGKASRVPASDSPGSSGVQNTQLTIRSTSGSTNGQYWNGSAFTAAVSWLTATGTTNWTYPFPRPADGTYTVAARTTDLAGNTGATTASSTTVDTAAPAVTIANPPTPSANTTPTLTGGYGFAAGDTAAVTVQPYNGSTPVGSPLNTTLNPAAHTWSVTVPALAPGTYTARASQPDAAGNTGAATTAAFTVTGTAAPNAPVISYPTNNATISAGNWAGAITGSASETGGTSVQYTEISVRSTSGSTNGQYFDGTSGFTSTVTWLKATGTASWSYRIPAQPGTYTISAKTVDNSSRTGPTTSSNLTIN